MSVKTETETRNAEIARAYFAAWDAKDWGAYRELLADDVDFVGALGKVAGADEAVKGIASFAHVIREVKVEKIWVDGEDVITWFHLLTTAEDEPVPVANYSKIRDGKIVRIRAAFEGSRVGKAIQQAAGK